MNYNWEEIFKEKSTNELYKIYCGKSFLPVSVIPFAKEELEKRNVDLKDSKDMVFHIQFNALAEEAADLLLYLQRNPIISKRFILVIIILIIVPTILLCGYYDLPVIIAICTSAFVIMVFLIMTAIKNYMHKKKANRLLIIEKELQSLTNRQHKITTSSENTLSTTDFDTRVRSKVNDSLKFDRNVALIIIIVLIALFLFTLFIK